MEYLNIIGSSKTLAVICILWITLNALLVVAGTIKGLVRGEISKTYLLWMLLWIIIPALLIWISTCSALAWTGLVISIIVVAIFIGCYVQHDHKFGRFNFATSGLAAIFIFFLPSFLLGRDALEQVV